MSMTLADLRDAEISVDQTPRLRSSPRIGQAMQELPRSLFVGFRGGVVQGAPVDISLSKVPTSMVTAALIGAVEPKPDDHVLEVGTRTGYTAAILAALADKVETTDHSEHRAEHASKLLRSFGLAGVDFHTGNRLEGVPEAGPFDAIIVSFPTHEIPDALVDQLATGGQMCVPLQKGGRRASLVRVRSITDGNLHYEVLGTVPFRSRLGDLLVDFQVLPRSYLERVTDRARATGRTLGKQLLDEGAVDEETLYHLLSLQHSIQFGTVAQMLNGATQVHFKKLPERYMRHNQLIPLKIVDETLIAVTTEPQAPFEELRSVSEASEVEPYLVTPTAFRRIWDAVSSGRIRQKLQQAAQEFERSSASTSPTPPPDPDDELRNNREADSAAVRLFDTIMYDAVAERATDIHFECTEDDIQVRFRIDGELEPFDRYGITHSEYDALLNVIKIAANLDITERRLPQGGRFGRRLDGDKIDLRVQTQPSLHGEFCVIRLLPQDDDMMGIDELGFAPDVADQYRRLVESPSGLILVVGPTGSGKSTTLYAGLRHRGRDPSDKVITVEDPIEYEMQNVQQTQVHSEIGFSFPEAVRAFLRQDPDVIMVGEIRDHETALEAIRASQTGHLVLSTLHANDAASTIQRLLDLGLNANSIASELVGIFAQRLAKRICTNCQTETSPDQAILEELFPDGAPDEFTAYDGRGCSRCDGRGTRGRIAVVEALPVGSDIREVISQNPSLGLLREASVDSGLTTLRTSAVRLVREGVTPLEELPRILSPEMMSRDN
jgi:type IV pilus assembly protein PilB